MQKQKPEASRGRCEIRLTTVGLPVLRVLIGLRGIPLMKTMALAGNPYLLCRHCLLNLRRDKCFSLFAAYYLYPPRNRYYYRVKFTLLQRRCDVIENILQVLLVALLPQIAYMEQLAPNL